MKILSPVNAYRLLLIKACIGLVILHSLWCVVIFCRISDVDLRIIECLATMLLLLLCLTQVSGYLIPVQNDQYPVLFSNDDPIVWSRGRFAELMSTHQFVRVNERGVRFFNGNLRGLSGWTASECNLTESALCSNQGNEVFSTSPPLIAQSVQSIAADVFREVAGRGCNKTNSQRVFSSQPFYSISTCDVIDGDLDLLWVRGMVFVRYNRIDTLLYLSIGLVIIYLVIAVSCVISMSFRGSGSHPGIAWILAACVLTVILVLCDTGFTGTSFVTREDFLMFYLIGIYILFYLVYWLWFYWPKIKMNALHPSETDNETPFCMVVATVLFTVCGFYQSLETPYTLPLVFFLLVRLINKTLEAEKEDDQQKDDQQKADTPFQSEISSVMRYYDALIIGTVYYGGVRCDAYIPRDVDLFFGALSLFAYIIAKHIHWI